MSEEARAADEPDYWSDSRRPLSSLIFLIPWIAAYELGVLWTAGGTGAELRSGADFWMRSWLSAAGLTQVLLLPLLVAGALLAWHGVRRHPWRVRLETLIGMFAESLLLAIGLVAFGQLHDMIFRYVQGVSPDPGVLMQITPADVSRAISFLGAGVYEEVMFRLLLVPAGFLFFRAFEFPAPWAAVMAAVASSFLFALAHHVGPASDAFNLFTFSFRAAAGLFFSAVFFLRGFGITVGCHSAYDLLVGVLLVAPSV